MAAFGSNIGSNATEKTRIAIIKALGLHAQMSKGPIVEKTAADTAARKINIGYKVGAPATNTAADAPSGLGDLCFNTSANTVYRCSAYTDGSTFTWTRIV